MSLSNSGGIGTPRAIGMKPSTLRRCIQDTKALLKPGKPFGVDLPLPKIRGGTRYASLGFRRASILSQ